MQDGSNNHRVGIIINPANSGAVSSINKIILAAIRHNHDVQKILKNAKAIISGEKNAADFDIGVCICCIFQNFNFSNHLKVVNSLGR